MEKASLEKRELFFDTPPAFERDGLAFCGKMISCLATSSAVWAEEEEDLFSGEFLLLDFEQRSQVLEFFLSLV